MNAVNGRDRSPPGWFDDGELAVSGDVFAGVVFNRPVDQVFTYRVPAGLDASVEPGQRVRVPLGRGNQPAIGYCVRVDRAPPVGVEPDRIKDVIEALDDPPLVDPSMLELTQWIAGYYACSWGQALDAAVPGGVKKHAGTRVGTFLSVAEAEALKAALAGDAGTADSRAPLSPKQAEALEILRRSDEPLTIADLCRLARCGTAPIAALRSAGSFRLCAGGTSPGPSCR